MFTEGSGSDFNVLLLFFALFPVGLSQAVPLVPLSEANEEAMENKNFRKLLRKLGIRAPADEQVCVCLCFVHFLSLYSNESINSEVSLNIVNQTVNNFVS